jgi:nucleotide-binding universal stress UspA family protein
LSEDGPSWRALLPEPRAASEPSVAEVRYVLEVHGGLDVEELAKIAGIARAACDSYRELAKLLAAALAKANVRPEDGPSWKTHVQYGSPRMVVEKAMKKAETDLLVLGTHGYSGAAYVFLGTVAGDLLRAAKCDVLVVPH